MLGALMKKKLQRGDTTLPSAKHRGDTIVEVVLAFAVFSMVSVGTMTVMGQGTNAAQRALEITLVRQQIDAQAEALRAAQQAYAANSGIADNEWRKIARASVAENSTVYADETACPASNAVLQRSFIMDPRNASLVNDVQWFQDIASKADSPFAQVVAGANVRSYGMWIEREFKPGGTVANAFDFKVRACWYAAGMDIPMQLETVVRLYEPGV